MKDLKTKAVRGGVAKAFAQAATFLLRIGSVAALARLLAPQEFGLVNMVTAVTGMLTILKDAGLSLATIQVGKVSEEQLSALFWVNVLLGAFLTAVCLALGPALASFYREPRLTWVTASLAPGFLLNGLGVQHGALLGREMRFVTSAAIDVAAITVSAVVGIGMALARLGYWSLVGMSLALTATSTIGSWVATGWVPSRPRRGVGVSSLLHTGGAVTLNSIIVYVAYNLEKVLLGRFWGASAIGLYGRAYQLVSIPTENLNVAFSGVVISALSRLQDDPARLKSYFLKAYSLVLALTLPAALACALFADEIILVVLGPNWSGAGPILRLLTPTVVVFAIISPMFWLLFATGLIKRSLRQALVIAPLVIGGYAIGLPYGPKGVALAYSTALTLWVVPGLLWSIHGTPVRFADVVGAVSRPMLSALAAAAVCLALRSTLLEGLGPVVRLALGVGCLGLTYAWLLLYAADQKGLYLDLLRSMVRRAPPEEASR